MPGCLLVLTTMPDDERADELARTLVAERLAACVHVGSPIASTYRWQGEIQREAERPVTIKTTAARLGDLERRLHALHPYEVPEFLVVATETASAAYVEWVEENTRS